MRLAQYTFITSDHRLAWVEEDGSLVDAIQAYEWDCLVRGIQPDQSRREQLQSLSRLIQSWQARDRFLLLEEMRERWHRFVREGHEGALKCRIGQPGQSETEDAKDSRTNLQIPFAPISFRDFYAFEQHVKTARARRGLTMVPEWYQMPVFYFSNPRSFQGPREPVAAPAASVELDFELEVAGVLGTPGESIPAREADRFIAGFVLLNDWSARDLQREEMKVGLGPAKGKDFATSFGPYFVTPDELTRWDGGSQAGTHYDVDLHAFVNGKLLSRGNLKDLYFTFAEMVERASRDVALVPGEVLGSGTVGTGCILELGTDVHPWLTPGDTVRFEAGPLGVLETKVVKRGVSRR